MSYLDNNHGHVFKRSDGHVTKCGGPSKCSICARDQAQMDARLYGAGFLAVDAAGKLKRLVPDTVLVRREMP